MKSKSHPPKPETIEKNRLKGIAAQTVEICRSGVYQNSKGVSIDISNDIQLSLQNTQLYLPDFAYSQNLPQNPHHTPIIEIINETTISACRRAVKTLGISETATLVFASARNMCGGFLKGAKGQEESCAYSTTLYQSVSSEACKPYYEYHNANPHPMYTDRIIYTPNIVILRNDDYEILDEPCKANFIVCPAANFGSVQKFYPDDVPNVPSVMLDRIRKIIQVAIIKHNRCIILGAFGCGVFRNDPHVISQCFAKVLNEEGYSGYFDRIIFAIVGPGINAFQEVFHIEQ